MEIEDEPWPAAAADNNDGNDDYLAAEGSILGSGVWNCKAKARSNYFRIPDKVQSCAWNIDACITCTLALLLGLPVWAVTCAFRQNPTAICLSVMLQLSKTLT